MTYDFQSPSDIQRDVLISIHSQNYDLFSKTIEKIPDLNAPFFEGKTLLQMTAKHPFTAGLRLLLEKNCDPNNHDEWRQSPLGYAVNSNNYPAVKMLLDHGANPNVRFKYQTEIDEYNFENHDVCPLGDAIEKGYTHMVTALLEKGANPNSHNDGMPHIFQAVKTKKENILQLLCYFNADVNVKDEDGNTPLHIAVIKGMHCSVKMLLNEYRANPCIKNNNADLPLHLAMQDYSHDLVHQLQWHGSPIYEQNCAGKSAVSIACEQNSESGLEVLFDHWLRQSYPYQKEGMLNGFLFLSVKHDIPFATQYLVQHVTDFNITDDSGKTPLHHVCILGKVEQLGCLLQHVNEIDLNKKDLSGKTPLDYAQENSHTEIIQKLNRFGAKSSQNGNDGNDGDDNHANYDYNDDRDKFSFRNSPSFVDYNCKIMGCNPAAERELQDICNSGRVPHSWLRRLIVNKGKIRDPFQRG